ncbi:hypothetical protein BKK79_36515 (plasmid) [Cupriavidus sp. USMAA2-4]|uniref:hypothetical protein n=1 Tax=Cupriavidus sp. USMAA2-4 TaxID=876364 RepID=UPI0008A70CB1|nr:hypothetical protein [Cupriavidus sp. USMAA2-4]AOY97454.1 hypothetical protein BKK79_36515 [Cupriavidus sp. USMAA2-4]
MKTSFSLLAIALTFAGYLFGCDHGGIPLTNAMRCLREPPAIAAVFWLAAITMVLLSVIAAAEIKRDP